METIGEIIKLIPFILLVLYVISFNIAGAKASKHEKTHEKDKAKEQLRIQQENEAAIREELELVRKSHELLPNVDAAIGLLGTKYHWLELTSIININSLSLTLMHQIPLGMTKELTLPNMQAERYTRIEQRIFRNAKKTHNRIYDENAIYVFREDEAGEPTVDSLHYLVNSDYVSTDKPVTDTDRDYSCTLTERGKALLVLDYRFKHLGNQIPFESYIRRKPISPGARELIRSVLYRSILEVQQGLNECP